MEGLRMARYFMAIAEHRNGAHVSHDSMRTRSSATLVFFHESSRTAKFNGSPIVDVCSLLLPLSRSVHGSREGMSAITSEEGGRLGCPARPAEIQ